MSRSERSEYLVVVADAPIAKPLQQAREMCGDSQVAFLALTDAPEPTVLPATWRRLRSVEFLDTTALREDFLSFLDGWPRRRLPGGTTFDELFRRGGGYSTWWTGVGRDRHQDRGVFPHLKFLWVCDRAIRSTAPTRVLIHTRRPQLAHALASRCRRDDVVCEFLPGSARPPLDPFSGRTAWLIKAIGKLCLLPCRVLLRSVLARLLASPTKRQGSRSDPSLVFVSELSRDVGIEGDSVSIWFWRELRQALTQLDPDLRHHVRLVYRRKFPWNRPAWAVLRRLDGALPPDERHAALAWLLRAVPDQLRSLGRYFQLEATEAFRDSFQFAGADVSVFYLPKLRRAVERSAEWAQAVAAARRSLREAGDVRALLVVKEFYASEMVSIAAARELGIPTVGVQHGAIFPMHLIYTLPSGCVAGAPMPDYFAVYGPYAKQVVSAYGTYPAERVWITGGARFDHLVRTCQDREGARRRLGLPVDKQILLVTTQNFRWFQNAVRALLQATRSQPRCVVVIKTHQVVDVPLDTYRRIARDVGADNVVFFSDRFNELLEACDVLVSASSTTIFEAILRGRRTVCINFSDEPDRYPYVADGGSLGASSTEELTRALELLLGDGHVPAVDAERERFLRHHAGPSREGKAAQTLAVRVLSLCRRPVSAPAACLEPSFYSGASASAGLLPESRTARYLATPGAKSRSVSPAASRTVRKGP